MAHKRGGWLWIGIIGWLIIGSSIPNLANADQGMLEDPNRGMGYDTKLLSPSVGIPFYKVHGDQIAIHEGSLVSVRSTVDGTMRWQLPTDSTSNLIGLDFDGTTIVWIDRDQRLGRVTVGSQTIAYQHLDQTWLLERIALTSTKISITFRANSITNLALIDRQSNSLTLMENQGQDMIAEGDWMIWKEVGHQGYKVIAYNLTTAEQLILEDQVISSNMDIEGQRVLIVKQTLVNKNTEVFIFDLASRSKTRLELPLLIANIKLAGDFIGWNNYATHGPNASANGLYHIPTGIYRGFITTYPVFNWDITTTPQPTFVWFKSEEVSDAVPVIRYFKLLATTFSLNHIPSAMQPEAPSTAAGSRYFAETQHNLGSPFSAYWQTHGGLPTFGYPLSASFDEVNRDTQISYPTQYLERQRFEHHVEHQGTVYEVLLGRLGAEILASRGRDWRDEGHDLLFAEQMPGPCLTFDTTQRTVCGPFLQYWQGHGLDFGESGVSYAESLALFGLPLTAPRYETNPDGAFVITQWFERARFEWHPNNPPEYQVLLGRLGDELLAVRGWRE